MRKLIILSAFSLALACNSPEQNADDNTDTSAAQNYREEPTPNTIPGEASDVNEGSVGLDTSSAPKDTSRATNQ